MVVGRVTVSTYTLPLAEVVSLPVSEVFGPTFQGEGPFTGVRTGFVRLGLCNLSCEWCDTPYTWDRTRYDLNAEAPLTTLAEVHQQLAAMDVDTVCLSGGEPLMHARRLLPLLSRDWTWHCETNGTINPPAYWSERVYHTSVSPKINTSDPLKKRIKPDVLRRWNDLAMDGRACFKFVAETRHDLVTIAELCGEVGIPPDVVWVMPLGTTAEQVITTHQHLAPAIEANGWNTTTRLHVLLYGQERRR